MHRRRDMRLPIELAAAQEMPNEEQDDQGGNLYSLGSSAGHNVVDVCLPASRIGDNPAAAGDTDESDVQRDPFRADGRRRSSIKHRRTSGSYLGYSPRELLLGLYVLRISLDL